MTDVWRLLFTSWNFFDQPGHQFRTRLMLHKRSHPKQERLWPRPVKRRWWRVVFNPAGNDYHYSKQLEARAALLSQDLQAKPEILLKTKEFRKYLDHISASVGPENFSTMNVILETRPDDESPFETLLSLTLPITGKVTQ